MKTPESTLECTHHWIIEIPNGRYSKGVCDKCKTNKLFDNVIEDNGIRNWKLRGKVQYV